jgi:nucleoside-diphosphate-sugar epimerase
MTIFITGASGFIGKATAGRLIAEGHRVVMLYKNYPDRLPAGGIPVHGDLGVPDPAWFAGGVDVFIHAAWIATPGEYLNSPLNGKFSEWSANLLPLLSEAAVRRVVGVGSCVECPPAGRKLEERLRYDLPAMKSPYVQAKLAWSYALAEWAHANDAEMVWARLFYPYGAGEHSERLPSFAIKRLRSGQILELKNPDSIKDYIHITDVARALATLATAPAARGVYHLGSGTGIAVRDLVLRIARLMSADATLVRDAVPSATLPDPHPFHVASTSKLSALGWQPEVPLDSGLAELVETYT